MPNARGVRGSPKWDWAEARIIAEKVGRSPKTIVDCWRDGRPIAPKAASHANKTEQVDLALEVFMSVYNGFPQPRTAIAAVCGTSAEAIRYIENKALRKMREATRDIVKEMEGHWK